MKPLLPLLLLLALPLKAEAGQNVLTGFFGPGTSFTKAFPMASNAGDLLKCATRSPGAPVTSITDANGNTWALLKGGELGSWAVLSAVAGISTPTFNLSTSGFLEISCTEEPGNWLLEQVVGPASGSGTSASITATTQNAGDLVIGYGSNSQTDYPSLTAGSGFTLEGVRNVFIEDGIFASPGPITVSAAYGSAVSPWFQYAAVFKPANLPPPPTFTFSGQVTTCAFCDGTDDNSLANALTLVAGATVTVSNGSVPICSGTFTTTAQFSCSGSLNTAPQMIPLTVTLTLQNGTAYSATQNILGILFQNRVSIILVPLFDSLNLQPRGLRFYTQ